MSTARLTRLEARHAKVDARFAKVDQRLVKVDERFAKVDERLTSIEREQLAFAKGTSHRFDVLEDQIGKLHEAVVGALDRQGEKARTNTIGFKPSGNPSRRGRPRDSSASTSASSPRMSLRLRRRRSSSSSPTRPWRSIPMIGASGLSRR